MDFKGRALVTLVALTALLGLPTVRAQIARANLQVNTTASTLSWQVGVVQSTILQVSVLPSAFTLSGGVDIDVVQCDVSKLSPNISQLMLGGANLSPVAPITLPGATVGTNFQFPPVATLLSTVFNDPVVTIANLTFRSPRFNLISPRKPYPVDPNTGAFSLPLGSSNMSWASVDGKVQPRKYAAKAVNGTNIMGLYGAFQIVNGTLQPQGDGRTVLLQMDCNFTIPLRSFYGELNISDSSLTRVTGTSHLVGNLRLQAIGSNPCAPVVISPTA